MRPTIAAIRRMAMGRLSLPAVAFVLAFPIAAQSVEGTAYLAPRDRAAAGGAAFEEAPPDTGTPVAWRGGVPGTDAADGHESFPLHDRAGRGDRIERPCRDGAGSGRVTIQCVLEAAGLGRAADSRGG